MAELTETVDELVGWCSSCDKLCYQSEYPIVGFDDEYATCSSCGDTQIVKADEYHGKLIEHIARAEAESQKLADELLDANMAWASKCEEVAALKAEVERRSAPVSSEEKEKYFKICGEYQVNLMLAERASAPATGKWEDPNALQLAYENFEVNSCNSWRVDTEGECPICAKEPTVRKEQA
jgi:hypothetical protein